MMAGSILVPIMAGFGLKDNVQADMPVANIHFATMRLDQLTSGKEDHPGMLTEVLVAILNEFCSGGVESSSNVK